jgi:predicted MPP superfamily phosphohydrolase
MKIITLGDTHGRSLWKSIVEKEKDFDKIIFIGDYFDARDKGYSANRQIENFKEILKFKEKNPEKVILLIGNHDFHYHKDVSEQYSGYQWHYANDIRDILQPAFDAGLLQMSFVYDKFVFTHAGITKTWVKNSGVDVNNLQESINNLFKTDVNKFKFTVGTNFSNYGDDITQSPIWVRPKSLTEDNLDDKLIFVVGHTTVTKIEQHSNIVLIDTLGVSQEYLKIEDGIIKTDYIKLDEQVQ